MLPALWSYAHTAVQHTKHHAAQLLALATTRSYGVPKRAPHHHALGEAQQQQQHPQQQWHTLEDQEAAGETVTVSLVDRGRTRLSSQRLEDIHAKLRAVAEAQRHAQPQGGNSQAQSSPLQQQQRQQQQHQQQPLHIIPRRATRTAQRQAEQTLLPHRPIPGATHEGSAHLSGKLAVTQRQQDAHSSHLTRVSLADVMALAKRKEHERKSERSQSHLSQPQPLDHSQRAHSPALDHAPQQVAAARTPEQQPLQHRAQATQEAHQLTANQQGQGQTSAAPQPPPQHPLSSPPHHVQTHQQHHHQRTPTPAPPASSQSAAPEPPSLPPSMLGKLRQLIPSSLRSALGSLWPRAPPPASSTASPSPAAADVRAPSHSSTAAPSPAAADVQAPSQALPAHEATSLPSSTHHHQSSPPHPSSSPAHSTSMRDTQATASRAQQQPSLQDSKRQQQQQQRPHAHLPHLDILQPIHANMPFTPPLFVLAGPNKPKSLQPAQDVASQPSADEAQAAVQSYLEHRKAKERADAEAEKQHARYRESIISRMNPRSTFRPQDRRILDSGDIIRSKYMDQQQQPKKSLAEYMRALGLSQPTKQPSAAQPTPPTPPSFLQPHLQADTPQPQPQPALDQAVAPAPTLPEPPQSQLSLAISHLTEELDRVKARLKQSVESATSAPTDIILSIQQNQPINELVGRRKFLERDISFLLKQQEEADRPKEAAPTALRPPLLRKRAPAAPPTAAQQQQQQQQQPELDWMDVLAGSGTSAAQQSQQQQQWQGSVFWPQSPPTPMPGQPSSSEVEVQERLRERQEARRREEDRARRRQEEEQLAQMYSQELEVEGDSRVREQLRARRAAAAMSQQSSLAADSASPPTVAKAGASPRPARQGGLFREHVPRTIEVPAMVSVRQLADLLDCTPSALETFLAEQLGDPPASLEDLVSPEAAELAALEWGHVAIVQRSTEQAVAPRPPVITIMGHVDHGKTSLLDALRHTSVAASEAGGITQHIGAFEVALPELGNAPLTFLDTPGHSAFSAMRARGASVTDIVVLVVAADDGIMPQTREALAHASSAGCPVVVAITKCDLQQAKPNAVKQALMVEGLEVEDFGGSVQVVHTSARSGAGLTDLAEALQLQAEMAELQAPAEGPAQGVVVEASNTRAGPQVALIVRSGRLKVGDTIVVGTEYGKVKSLRGTSRQATLTGVGPGQHALVTGLKGLPHAGDSVTVVADEDRARRISYARSRRAEEYRYLQSMAALHAQRAKESDHVAKLQGMKRELRVQRMALLAQRKQRTAQQLAELSAKAKQAEQEALAASAGPTPATPGQLPAPRGLTPTQSSRDAAAAGGAAAAAAAADGVAVGARGAEQGDVAAAPQAQAQPPKQVLRLIVKADVQGSMEAVAGMVKDLAADRVDLKILHMGVGQLTPNDINLAVASGAHAVSFNLGPSNAVVEKAMSQASAAGVKFISHNIVYHLMGQLEDLIEGASTHEIVEQVVGEAAVQSVFVMSSSGRKKENLPPGGGRIAGVRVVEGSVQRAAPLVRVVRDGQMIYEGRCSSMKRHKLDVDAVGSNTECGIVLDEGRFSDFQPGDVLQFVTSATQKVGSKQ